MELDWFVPKSGLRYYRGSKVDVERADVPKTTFARWVVRGMSLGSALSNVCVNL